MSDQDQTSSSGNEQTRSAETERGGDTGTGERGGVGRHSGRRRRGRTSTQPSQGQSRRAESSLNLEELRELTELFTEHRLTDFEFENADIRVRLSRNPAPQAGAQSAAPPPTTATPASTSAAQSAGGEAASSSTAPSGAGASSGTSHAEAKEEELHIITSPIVGTFYRASSPNADSFVKAGSHVEHDTVVCIIEAMKLMNEIQAETTGTVEKIYVENGQPVEFGQPLFGIKK
ncbi:MAG: acetyl-CoA carboxylase biotin carboxyl carrier protein [Acidobacteria bacterium]|nr:acetyl-CoA carboxylase biotin carboxyl carrier protein [Acidobacteriota bacterium]